MKKWSEFTDEERAKAIEWLDRRVALDGGNYFMGSEILFAAVEELRNPTWAEDTPKAGEPVW